MDESDAARPMTRLHVTDSVPFNRGSHRSAAAL